MNYAIASSELERKRIEIMDFKRRMKRHYGCKSEWPDFIRAKYEMMKDDARELQGAFGGIAA
jgi:hypothetical protein